jgi:Uma2 family endonuclease
LTTSPDFRERLRDPSEAAGSNDGRLCYNDHGQRAAPNRSRGEEFMGVALVTRPGESTDTGGKTEPIAPQTVVPDDMLYELVEGQLQEKNVGIPESEIATLLIEFLAPFLRSHRLGKLFGEAIFRIDQQKDLQRRPDVAYVSHSKWPVNRRAPKVSVWDLVPDLAIEVVSPTNSAAEVQRKIHEYFQAGVSRVWVIYPEQKYIHIYASTTQIQVLQLGDELDGGDLIPGFRLPLVALFEDDPE